MARGFSVCRNVPLFWGLFTPPNWRKADEYKHLYDASLQAIAWEFLRRNQRYQEAWSTYAASVRKMTDADAELLPYVKVILSSDSTAEDWDSLGDSATTNTLSARLDALGHLHKLHDNPVSFVALDAHCGMRSC